MAGIAQNGQKIPYFHCGPSTKTRKYQREIEKKNRKTCSKYKKIYKLKWLTP